MSAGATLPSGEWPESGAESAPPVRLIWELSPEPAAAVVAVGALLAGDRAGAYWYAPRGDQEIAASLQVIDQAQLRQTCRRGERGLQAVLQRQDPGADIGLRDPLDLLQHVAQGGLRLLIHGGAVARGHLRIGDIGLDVLDALGARLPGQIGADP